MRALTPIDNLVTFDDVSTGRNEVTAREGIDTMKDSFPILHTIVIVEMR